ncbi:hypothetical protein [Mycobacteroides salmoniphilum]|uniref:hypothetical protein n=1 Tax=Mycobacteroides salmoniphilum TaxID=404941 RepID=UPI00177D6D67|nr:hypothetical protein [Mycobacteroides salmoniphilum]
MALRVRKSLLGGSLRRVGGLLLRGGGIGGSLRILVGLLIGRCGRLRAGLVGGCGFQNRLRIQRCPSRIVGVVTRLFGRCRGRRSLRLFLGNRRIGGGIGCRPVRFRLAQCRTSSSIGSGLGHQVRECGGTGCGVRITLRLGGRRRARRHGNCGQGSRVRRQTGVTAEK